MSITGDLSVMIAALGHPFGDKKVLDALTLVGLPTERRVFEIGPVKRTYYTAEQKMAEFLFEDDVLDTVMVFTVPTEERGAYPTPDTLIDGLSGTASRDEVRARFGDPEWKNETADRFKVDGGYVRFEYADDRITEITAMLTVPG